MLHKGLRWFYCLPVSQAFFVLIIFSVLFLLLRKKLGCQRFWRLGMIISVIAWLLFIFAATLISRSFLENRPAPEWIPFYSYYMVFSGGNKEILRSNFMNITLFFPAGLLAGELLPEKWRQFKKALFIGLLFALLSAGIECCQFFFALGQAQTDDVIHNALGAFLGALVCTFRFSTETTTAAEDD